jgi:hypothetical protein
VNRWEGPVEQACALEFHGRFTQLKTAPTALTRRSCAAFRLLPRCGYASAETAASRVQCGEVDLALDQRDFNHIIVVVRGSLQTNPDNRAGITQVATLRNKQFGILKTNQSRSRWQ